MMNLPFYVKNEGKVQNDLQVPILRPTQEETYRTETTITKQLPVRYRTGTLSVVDILCGNCQLSFQIRPFWHSLEIFYFVVDF